jgi:ribosomal protein S18 acetylase RimI-like enzyme
VTVNSNSPSKIRVRPATPADIPALGRLGTLLVSLHHQLDPNRFIAPLPNTESAYAAFLHSELKRPDAIVLVADDGETVVGYTYSGLEGKDYMALRGPAGVVYDLIVDPERRREGIGRMLLDATLAALVARGAPRIVLSTADQNETAQRLFASAGFRRTMIEMTREIAKAQ